MKGGIVAVASPAWLRLRTWVVVSVREFFSDHCPQFAAAIAYWTLFALFPLAILIAAAAGLVLSEQDVRERLIDTLLANVTLTADAEASLAKALSDVLAEAAVLGVVGALTLLWTASGLMTTVRTALNVVWDTDQTRPFLRGKIVDVLLVGSVGLFVALSVSFTVGVRVLGNLSARAAAELGPLAALASAGWALELLIPVAVSFLAFVFAFRFVPAATPSLSAVWPGALVAALAFEGAKLGFAFYLRSFAEYGAVYGSLGTVAAYLFFVYLSANIFLLGAELASEHARLSLGAAAAPRDPIGRRARARLTRGGSP